MNFKTIRKVGLSALLAGTFALGPDVSVAAPVQKDTTTVTMTAKQANRKMKRIFAEQENLLSAKQLEMWKTFKSHPDFDLILPEIKMNMDITKICEDLSSIYVPFETCKNIKDPAFPDIYRRNFFKTLKCLKGGGHALRVCISYFINNDDVIPTHDVPDFVKCNRDCYFYTPKAELNTLSGTEKEYIQTLDKALNTVYHHIYGNGFAKIDLAKLAKGKMAGKIYDLYLLSTRFGKYLKFSHKSMKESIRKSFAHWLEGRSELELQFYDVLGYPLTMQDYVKASRIDPIAFHIDGGCEGESLYSMTYSGQFAIPDAIDLSKDKKRLDKILYQMNMRQLQGVASNAEELDKGIEAIATNNLPNASERFKKILKDKIKTVHLYNKKLYLKAERLLNKKLPPSIAATGVLDSYISKNLALKTADEKILSPSQTNAENDEIPGLQKIEAPVRAQEKNLTDAQKER